MFFTAVALILIWTGCLMDMLAMRLRPQGARLGNGAGSGRGSSVKTSPGAIAEL